MKSIRVISRPCLLVLVCIVALAVPAHGRKHPSAELVEQLSNGLSITPDQATAGAGALFSLAKSRLSPSDFKKISDAVPGMSSFLKAAPSTSGDPAVAELVSALPPEVGDVASAALAFQKLNLSPDMIMKFLPILMSYIESKGGAELSKIFSGVFKHQSLATDN